MDEREELLIHLTDKDAAAACALSEEIVSESRENACWYPYIDRFAALLRHKNSLVRNRAIAILAANARWDTANRYDAFFEEFLSHVADEKPITARKCIQALPEIAAAKPELCPHIRAVLERVDGSGYRESMQLLLVRDAKDALEKIK